MHSYIAPLSLVVVGYTKGVCVRGRNTELGIPCGTPTDSGLLEINGGATPLPASCTETEGTWI